MFRFVGVQKGGVNGGGGGAGVDCRCWVGGGAWLNIGGRSSKGRRAAGNDAGAFGGGSVGQGWQGGHWGEGVVFGTDYKGETAVVANMIGAFCARTALRHSQKPA